MEIFGGLIEFENRIEFNKFVKEMDNERSLIIIEKAILFGFQNDIYSIEESHALYVALSNIKFREE